MRCSEQFLPDEKKTGLHGSPVFFLRGAILLKNLLASSLCNVSHITSCAIDQLNVGHRRIITAAVATLEDTDITAWTLKETWTQISEKLANCRPYSADGRTPDDD